MTFDTVSKTSESGENVTSSVSVEINEPGESENMVDSPLTEGGTNLLHVILKDAGGAVIKDQSSEDGAATTTNSQDTTGHGDVYKGEKMGSNDVETTRAVGKARKVRQRRKQHSLQSSSSSISTIESTNTTNSLDKQLEYQKRELCKSRLRELILHHYLEQNYDDYFQQQQTCFEPSLNRGKSIKLSQRASVNSEDKAKLVVDRLIRLLRKLDRKNDKDMGSGNIKQRPKSAGPPRKSADHKQYSEAEDWTPSPQLDTQQHKHVDTSAGDTRGILKPPHTAVGGGSKHVRMQENPIRMKKRDRHAGKDDVTGLPGEMSSYAYLIALLNTLQGSDEGYVYGDKRVSLVRAPVRPRTAAAWRPPVAKTRRRLRTGSALNDTNPKWRPKPPATINTKADKSTTKTGSSTPQVRPGSDQIRCNWDPDKDTETKPEIKACDHQLKNSDNPAVRDWLKHKNELARRNRINDVRKNKVKRELLMEEFNEIENKKEKARSEYEKWKRKKNSEILLRRRAEAHVNALTSSDWKQQKETSKEESNLVQFSDLRSSASSSAISKKTRPKSAPSKVSFATKTDSYIPVKIDFSSGDVTVLGPREKNLSAREPLVNSEDGTRKKSGKFLKEFMEVTSRQPSMFDIPPPGGRTGKENTDKAADAERKRYNNWVKTGKKAPPRRKNTKSKLPPHDPMSNELISDLAKRRIKKIMDQKKRVDSGLRRGDNEHDQNSGKDNNVKNKERQKWRLNEPVPEPEETTNSKPREDSNTLEKPRFSYDRKTKSKSLYNERNPVLRQAVQTL